MRTRTASTARARRFTGVRSGITFIETLIVIGIIGILAGIVAVNLRPLNNEATNAANAVAAGLKQARARAMANTSAYRLLVTNDGSLTAEHAVNCTSSNWTPDSRYDVSLDYQATLAAYVGGELLEPGDVAACFDSRGFAQTSTAFNFTDTQGRTRAVELFVGGAVEIQ